MFSPGDLNAVQGQFVLGGVGSHEELSQRCSACHAPAWSRENMSDRCLACHEDTLRDGENFHTVMLAQAEQDSCRQCHSDHNGRQAFLTRINLEEFPHAETGFSLATHRMKRIGVNFACQDCHVEGITNFSVQTCLDCHSDLDSTFTAQHVQVFSQDCLACHDGVDRYDSAFDHNQLAFQLRGGHADVACVACHAGDGSLQALQSTLGDCHTCHMEQDAHQGRLGRDCAACHTVDTWQEAAFDHSATDFPLAGGHAGVECSQCHPAQAGAFVDTPTTCFACHAVDDAHQGQLGMDCAACHTVDTWQEAAFDHSATNFPLTGGHAGVECSQCHSGGAGKVGETPTVCFACHTGDDAHQGRFGKDCSGCHTTESWQAADFDHSKASFVLVGAHVQVPCQECHQQDSGGTVFAGTPQECAACHADPQFHQGLFGSDCAACHTAQGWSTAKFDQAHTFPVNHGASSSSECRLCHPDSLQAYTCYGCHEHTPANIEGKHREEGIRNLQDCARCHPTGREEEGEREGD
jgi:hypothetical protein